MFHRPNQLVLWLAALLVAGRTANACDLCAIYGAMQAQGSSGKGFFAGLAEQYTYFNTFQSDGHDAPNPDGESLHSLISQAFVGYNFNERFGVQFNLPVIYRDYAKTGAHGSVAGIGDVSLLGNVHIIDSTKGDTTFSWTALGGIKFPTGSTDLLNPADPEFADGIGGHDLTLGSGSYDGVVGTGFWLGWKRVFLSGVMQYAIRTEGDFQYQFANDWTWYGGPGFYLVLEDKNTLSLQAVVSGETKGMDTVGGVAVDDTAITSVFLGPQINYSWSSRLSAQLAGDLPVSIVSSGQQIVPNFRIRAAVTYRF